MPVIKRVLPTASRGDRLVGIDVLHDLPFGVAESWGNPHSVKLIFSMEIREITIIRKAKLLCHMGDKRSGMANRIM